LAPFEPRLIKTEMLTREELVFLDAYNQRVRGEIGPMVDGETLAWLEAATAPFEHG
jgi:Xaa-Pro aminopeptidase